MLEDREPTIAELEETERWMTEMVEDDVMETLYRDVFGE